MIKLIIPSAKIIPEELQSLGKLPSVIFPINDNTVFSYLYKQYVDRCDIEVLCFEKAEKVHKKLEKYTEVKITDIKELGDLAQTIYYGLNTESPVIINFGDTIVMDNIYDNPPDCFYYAEDFASDKWTFFNIEDGTLKEIYDKSMREGGCLEKEKVFVGVFFLSNASFFKQCLEKSFGIDNKSISTFYYALRLYSETYPLNAIETLNWFDIGHVDRYYATKLEVEAREFNHIEVDKNRGILKKCSDDRGKLICEIKWYLKLPTEIEYIRPRIFDYSLDYNNPFVSMEYYAYHTVHELFLNSDLSINQWETIFNRIRFIFHDLKKYTVADKGTKTALEEMYFTKTIQRLDAMKQSQLFFDFFDNPIIVNGKRYMSLNRIVDELKRVIPQMLYNVEEFCIIHGDLCFTNMMIDHNLSFIKVIDPRGRFGKYDIYGDARYDLAKLFHSVDGKYDYIIKDLFTVNCMGNTIEFTIQDKDRDFDLYQVFTNVFQEEIGDRLKEIELIEALLFFSMIPLHSENVNHQLAMTATGIEILNRVIDVTERAN